MAKLGINVLKENLTIIASLVNTIDESLADKKVNVYEGIKIALKGISLIKVVKTIKDAKAEFLDLDGAEKGELVAHFKNEFKLRDREAELMVENIVSITVGLSDNFKLLEIIKKQK